MAGLATLVKTTRLPTKPAEVVSKIVDKKVAERYFVRTKEEEIDFSIPDMDADATIDLQRLLDSEEEFQKFESLLYTWGCFQLVNHGITSAKLDEVRQIAKEFFELPLEVKEKYRRAPEHIEGWGGDRMSEDQAFNWNDRLILTIYPLAEQKPKFWPGQD